MKNPVKTLIENVSEMIGNFREEYPGGIREYVQEVLKDRAESRVAHRRWKRLPSEERAFKAIIQDRKSVRARITECGPF